MLRDLTVQNYRCFENFHIDGLERVNLLVGKNNSGKTSLLEAIYLLSNEDKISSLMAAMRNRGEVSFISESFNHSANFVPIESIESLFYKYEILENETILFQSNFQNIDNKYQKKLEISCTRKSQYTYQLNFIDRDNDEIISKFSIETDKEHKLILDSSQSSISFSNYKEKSIFISNPKKIIRTFQYYWNDIYLTDKEDKVIKAIQLLEPKIARIGFYFNENHNTVRFQVKDQKRPIPLSSMGDGMYRFLLLAICIVSTENGFLLVDEIETGLHYEAQIDMWRLILETSKELNVQVFATTHSWDCIAAFQEALEEFEDQSIGKLFRLDSKYGKLRAVSYDAEDLEVVTRESIEVR